MNTPTPRTDACLAGREHGNSIEFLARELERELAAVTAESLAKDAQIVALRAAILKTGHGGPRCLCDSLCSVCQALSNTPPTPVVPLADVKPLVDVLAVFCEGAPWVDNGDGCATVDCLMADLHKASSALAAFTAKHPTP